MWFFDREVRTKKVPVDPYPAVDDDGAAGDLSLGLHRHHLGDLEAGRVELGVGDLVGVPCAGSEDVDAPAVLVPLI